MRTGPLAVRHAQTCRHVQTFTYVDTCSARSYTFQRGQQVPDMEGHVMLIRTLGKCFGVRKALGKFLREPNLLPVEKESSDASLCLWILYFFLELAFGRSQLHGIKAWLGEQERRAIPGVWGHQVPLLHIQGASEGWVNGLLGCLFSNWALSILTELELDPDSRQCLECWCSCCCWGQSISFRISTHTRTVYICSQTGRN